ncbi:MAG: radical SAM protein [Bacteroidales bacterium]
MYKYVFGPVPSRRLGMSLGVDLVPKKVCSNDCVYCEVGSTTCLTTKRKEYVPIKKIIEELEDYFSKSPDPDYFTFSGYGEPTLNSGIGKILNYIKEKRPNIPVAVITNGSIFSNPSVREDLMNADVVLPSLDAATQKAFEKINRPAADIKIDEYVQGLVDFRKDFKNKIWLEIFILPGYNDAHEELVALKKAIDRIKPDSIQLNTLDRPGTVEGLRPATRAELQSIVKFWGLDNCQIISAATTRKNVISYRTDIETAIMETISRRPCTLDDLSAILGMHVNELNKYLDVLDSEHKVITIREERGLFYQLPEKKNI